MDLASTSLEFLADDFDEILRLAPDAVIVHDMTNRVLYWNASAEKVYGWTAEEIKGYPIDRICYLDAKERELVISKMRDSGTWEGELRQIDRNGDEHLVRCRQRLIRNQSGEPAAVISFNTDMTEFRKLQDAEKRAHHIRSSSLLAGGIAHDLNNALAPIMLSSAMLKRIVQEPKALGMISMIEKCAGRGAELISHLLAFERGKRAGNEIIRTTQIERAIRRVSEDIIPESIELRSEIQTDFWDFRGDTAEIGKVFRYLAENACEAMPEGGVLSISAGNRLFDENYENLAPEAKAGTYVAFVFVDTGGGIDRGILDRVAEPFFTTKEPSQGSGFGLSSAQAIIKGHGGFMIIESEIDEGTSVSVFIPAEMSPSKVKGSAPPFAIRKEGNGKLILVADDELFIRETIKRTLEDRGYDVIITQDGTEALAIYASRIDEIDLVVTNVEMPFMDGPSLCRALFKLKPEVKILVSSGHKQPQKVAEIRDCGVEHFLAKPYTADNLADHVHEIVFETGKS